MHELFSPSPIAVNDSGYSESVEPSEQFEKKTNTAVPSISASRTRLINTLSTKFDMPFSGWQNCSGSVCKSDTAEPIAAIFSRPEKQADKLDEVLAHLDKVFQAAHISKIVLKSPLKKDEFKYHVTPIADTPEPVELLAPLTINALETAAARSEKKSANRTNHEAEISLPEQTTLRILKYVQMPLLQNLMAAFERKHLDLDRQDLKMDHKPPEFHFDRAIVRLRLGEPLDRELESLRLFADGKGISKCQSDKTNRLIKTLNILSSQAPVKTAVATGIANELIQDLPDDLYRLQALNELALKSDTSDLPGLTDSDTKKDMLHSMAVILLLCTLTISSPIFAFILIKNLLAKDPTQTSKPELSAVTYGWKRMLCVFASLIISLVLLVAFEYAFGFASEMDSALLAINYPIARILSDLIASCLFNLPIFLVYFVWSIPSGISFSEAFGLRISTVNFSFQQLCTVGLIAYLALNAVTTVTMIFDGHFSSP